MKDFAFRKCERILKRDDYLRVGKRGRKIKTRCFIVIADKNTLGISRLGITASRKTGNAVERNRAKRIVREFFRLNGHQLRPSVDYLIIAGRKATSLSYFEARDELMKALKKMSFLKPHTSEPE